MNHKIYTLALSALSLAAAAQTSVTFDTQDYKSVGVYDTWEESPFRTGTLEGNAQVINNCFNNTGAGISNKTTKILGVQRSRFESEFEFPAVNFRNHQIRTCAGLQAEHFESNARGVGKKSVVHRRTYRHRAILG